MNIYVAMPKALRPFYKEELIQAKKEIDKKHYQQSWYHLGRAYILGQSYPVEHTAVHWKNVEIWY